MSLASNPIVAAFDRAYAPVSNYLIEWSQLEYGVDDPMFLTKHTIHWTEFGKYLSFGWIDLPVLLGFILLWHKFRFFFQRNVRRECRPTLPEKDDKKCKIMSVKYAESVWKTLFYFWSLMFGLGLLACGDWISDPRNFWRGAVHANATFGQWLFYLFELAFYIHSLWAHLFRDVRRKDFVVMAIHHVVTIFLIGFSYLIAYYKIGIMVIFVHDISDFLLEIAKTYLYRNEDTAANAWFGLWVVSWVAFRLTIFPLFVMKTCWYDSAGVNGSTPLHDFFNSLLAILLLMHIYWFYLIVSLLYRMATGVPKVVDTREEHIDVYISSDEEDNNNSTRKPRNAKKKNK